MLSCFKLGLLEPEFTHFLVLQDDILPSKDLIKTANELVYLRPNDIISLYSAQPSISNALHLRKSWVSIDRLYGLCAYIIPSFMAKDYVDNYVDKIKDDIKADDVKISVYLEAVGKRAYLTAPSLVEHIAWDRSSQHKVHVPKLNALTHRIAEHYIGFENSGLDIDWQNGLEEPFEINIGGKYDHVRHLKKK